MALIFLIVFLGIFLALPWTQSKIAHYATDLLNKDFGINLAVDKVYISVFGSIELDHVLAIDHHNDTLFYVKKLKTKTLDFKAITNGNVIAGFMEVDSLLMYIKTYKNEDISNLDVFINAFDDGKPTSGKFLMTSPELKLENSQLLVIDENADNPNQAGFKKIGGKAKSFKINGSDVFANLSDLQFLESNGLKVDALNSKFVYTKFHIYLDDLKIKTPHSNLEGQVHLLYEKTDFEDFNNSVVFKGFLTSSQISSNDIAIFTSEIGSNLIFDINTKFKGTLNNLDFDQLTLETLEETFYAGNISLINSFNDEGAFMLKTEFTNFTTQFDDLITLLPSLLENKLPTEFKKFGILSLVGTAKITKDDVFTDIESYSDLGFIKAKVQLSNLSDSENIIYVGQVKTNDFQLGKLLNQSNIGLLSSYVEVDGKGFDTQHLDAYVKGNISKFGYNKYNYNNIKLEGNFKNPLYNGVVYVNDPNLFMDFVGLIDVSESKEKFDFDVYVDYADLKKLNWMNDSISIFKGNISANFTGTAVDNLEGKITLKNASYQNPKDIFLFEDFNIKTFFNEKSEKVVSFKSKEIIDGYLMGNFKYTNLPDLFGNALGGIYKNFKPKKIKQNQYLKYDINVYNKLIEIFYPAVEIGPDTSISGYVNGNDNELQLEIKSPILKIFDNQIHNLSLSFDTNNPLYLSYIQADSLSNKNYTISDFNLINLTSRDTLFFRTEFKGGGATANRDFYNLNLYQTISNNNEYVVGFQKSDFTFKDYFWFVNENDNDENRIIIDKKFKNISFDELTLSHNREEIFLNGFLYENGNKNIDLSFSNVNIAKITPSLEAFNFSGNMNGYLNILQENEIYKPTVFLNIDQLSMNEVVMGELNFNMSGDDALKNFKVDASIQDEFSETMLLGGSINIVGSETLLNLDARFEKLNLDGFKNIGGDVISNLRGKLSGTALVEGSANEPIVNGRLFLNNAGLKIPYLNVDYELGENAIVDFTKSSIIFRDIPINDTEFGTKGILKGNIQHNYFRKWMMGLEISSDRLAVLNTEDGDEVLYFGQAFINGDARLSGPIDEMLISVNASSEKGTSIKIPINESLGVGDKSYLSFLSPEEKYAIGDAIKAQAENNGLELKFDLKINENAEIEVIIDRESGHAMKGKGRGSLLMEINTNGKFNMFGDFQVYEGYYDFKYRTVINKRLAVKKYGTIIWEGDPLQAQLNLEASYNVNANPSVLLQNPSFNRKVDTELVIGVKGTIMNPDLDFNFEFPTLSSVFNSEIQAQLNNKETRETQAIYVLATGSFITVDSGLSQSALSNNLYETLGGMLDNLFQDEDSKFKVGVDIVAADNTPGRELNGSVGVTTSFDINDRMSVNGKVGVPTGGMNQSSVVGNVEVLYRLNNSGSANLKAFNRENDINYIGEGIGFTQGLGLSYEVDFSSFGELIRRISRKKKKINNVEEKEFLLDNDYSEDYIDFIKKINEEKQKKPLDDAKKQEQEIIEVPEID